MASLKPSVKGEGNLKPKKAIHVEIGENIKRAREQAGFTQERFAEMIGLGPKSLSAIERGASGISLSALRRICQVLAIPSDDLLFYGNPKQDTSDIARRLERLSPAQYKVACDVMHKLLEAFSLPTG